MTVTITPRVWIGALGAYNAGHLIGKWCDADDLDSLLECAEQVINEAKSKLGYEGGEEIMLADNEGFGNLIGEYSPLEEVARIAELIEKHGDAFLAWAQKESRDFSDSDIESQFESEYRGEWEDEKEYAYNYADDCMEIPEHLENYIDWDVVVRELFHHGNFSFENGFVFEAGA